MPDVVLYGNGCSKCVVLEKMLKRKNVVFEKKDDLDFLIANGFKQVPVLKVDEKLLSFEEGFKWVVGRKQ